MAIIKVNEAIEAATTDQKDRLLELVIRRQGFLEQVAELTRDFKANKKELDEALTRVEVEIFSILEEVETGQKGMFDGEEGEDPNEADA